ncbi:ribonuclease P protein subunit p30, partial [Trifolium medium]|nr:ribonuclease P protein subunit p30 [Trifolium medium]
MDTNTSTSGQFNKRETDAVEVDEMPHQTPFDEMKTEDDSTVAIHSSPEVIMEDKKFGEVSTDSDQLASTAQSVSGRLRVKRRTPQLFFPPLKRLLNMVPFKKKGNKVKRRTNP